MSTKKSPPKFSGLVASGAVSIPDQAAASKGAAMPVFIGREAGAPAQPGEVGAAEGAATENGVPKPVLIPIASIVASQFQNRLILTEERIAALADNIRRDGLNNPVIVRALGAGRYELVAGETRMRACKYLGHTEIPAFVRDMDDAHSARSTVLDNFFHETLTDYEIYKGLRILLDAKAVASVRALAEVTPWGKTHVQRLMSFDKLPGQAHAILEHNPGLIGSNTAEGLASCLNKGGGAGLVVKALERIRDGKMTQVRAAAWVGAQQAKAVGEGQDAGQGGPAAVKSVITTPQGRPVFTLDRNGKEIRIRPSKDAAGDGIDWESLHLAIVEILKGHADKAGD